MRQASDPLKGQRVIADALPTAVTSILQPPELERVRQQLNQLPEPPSHPRLRKDDWPVSFIP